MEIELKQSILDEEHLRLLSLGFMISGAITAFFSLFGLFYAFMGVLMGKVISSAAKTSSHPEQAPPAEIGYFFGCFGLLIFIFLVGLALAKFRAASCIKQRKAHTFCMVIAGISCLSIPYGTCLGIATFMVLGRTSVRQLFEPSRAA